MASSVQICNMSLAAIAQTPIGSLADVSPNARVCNIFYDLARQGALRANGWKFATQINTLSQIAGNVAPATVTIPGWNFLYQYPANALSILKVYGDIGNLNPGGYGNQFPFDNGSEYGGSGRFNDYDFKHSKSDEFKELQDPTPNSSNIVIAADVNPAYCEYVADVSNTALFDANFLEALVFKLAALIAKPLTGDDKVAAAMLEKYQSFADRAPRINAQQGFNIPFNTSTILNAR